MDDYNEDLERDTLIRKLKKQPTPDLLVVAREIAKVRKALDTTGRAPKEWDEKHEELLDANLQSLIYWTAAEVREWLERKSPKTPMEILLMLRMRLKEPEKSLKTIKSIK